MTSESEKFPVVSVCCITYNHAAFLAQAIESVLMQKTDFAIEMVIGEDCSTDETRAIVLDYASRYPEQIRALLPEKNLGVMPNLMVTMAACRGEFIAFLEGDDYWTDENKLQLQVDALKKNVDCSFCFHDANIISDKFPEGLIFSQRLAPEILPSPSQNEHLLKFPQKEFIRKWIVPSASMLFRTSSLSLPLPEWWVGLFSGDRALHLLSTRHGLALYVPRIMSTYRVHEQGIVAITRGTSFHYEKKIYDGKMFQKHLALASNRKYADIYLAGQIAAYAKYLRDNRRYAEHKSLILNHLNDLIPRYLPFIKNKMSLVFSKTAELLQQPFNSKSGQ